MIASQEPPDSAMNTLHRCLPAVAWLLAAAPGAQAAEGVLAGDVDERWSAAAPARVALQLPAGLVAGAGSARLAAPLARDGARESDVYAGYRGNAGPLAYSALLHYYSYPDLGATRLTGRYDHGELSAGLRWNAVYAHYDYVYTSDYLGIPDARGTSYLDVGANQPIGRATFLNLNAGDGRVAGARNALWDWRDLRAGFSRKLDDGWLMSLNYRRVFGNGLLADRYGGMMRMDTRVPGIGRGHKGLVLSFKRGF